MTRSDYSSEYDEGFSCALEGFQLWDNPYTPPCYQIEQFNAWFAGWCGGMQHKQVKD